MSTFTTAQLACMDETQTAHMMDTCVIRSYAAGTANEYNESDAPTWTDGSALVCGVDMRPGSRRFGEEMTVIQYDAALRLPLGTSLKETDHIKITHRFGVAITALEYEIVSPIQRGPSALRVYLRKVVT